MLEWCTGEAVSVFVTPKNAMTVDGFLCSVPYFCMQHLFPLRSEETWKVIWWIRRHYLGGNENKSMQLSVASSSLSVTSTKLLLHRIFEMPGKEKQRDICGARSLPPWGFRFLFVGLTRSYPAILAHGGGLALTLQELPSGLYQNSCGLPEKQKRILSSFCDGNEERAPGLACMGVHCSSLNMPCYCWGSNKVCYYSILMCVLPESSLFLSPSFLLFFFFFPFFFPLNYTGNVLEGRVKRLKSGIFMYTRNLNVWFKLINSPHLFLFSL